MPGEAALDDARVDARRHLRNPRGSMPAQRGTPRSLMLASMHVVISATHVGQIVRNADKPSVASAVKRFRASKMHRRDLVRAGYG
jgi:hypothetical protein